MEAASIDKPQLEAELLKVLDKYDSQHKGVYQIDELGTLARLLGFNPTQKEVAALTKQIDPENKASFTETQLLETLLGFKFKVYTTREVEEAVGSLDPDNDGNIETKNLKVALTERAEVLTEEEFEKFIEVVDPDKTGSIKTADLLNFLKQ